MAQEIEVLYNLEEEIHDTLNKCGIFGNFKTEIVNDIYFNVQPKTCLRLRQDGYSNFTLTHKTDIYKGKKWLYSNEIETVIEDIDVVGTILENVLGIDVELKMIKSIFETLKYKIIIEKVEGLGNFLEVERRTKTKNIPKAKQEIRNFVKKLGIKVGKELNKGKPELMRLVLNTNR